MGWMCLVPVGTFFGSCHEGSDGVLAHLREEAADPVRAPGLGWGPG